MDIGEDRTKRVILNSWKFGLKKKIKVLLIVSELLCSRSISGCRRQALSQDDW